MPLTLLNALSPLDGRYFAKVAPLRDSFSEFGLIRLRLRVEIEWLKALCAEPSIPEAAALSPDAVARLDAVVASFSEADASEIKDIETRIKHDVKALEYWLRQRLTDSGDVQRMLGFIHFACTSEDINNLCHALMAQQSRAQTMLPALDRVIDKLAVLAHGLADLSMLSRTHGQPATPTTLGKEMANFAARLRRARARIVCVRTSGKINGAVGNYNAHLVAYPDVDWPGLARRFVERLGLEFNPYTTQIEPHDSLAELFDAYTAANTIIIGLDRDMWGYISLGYFKQRAKPGEVGSSTMPHKVNPIDFENSEGNLGIANALLQHLATKLPVSRWQRDLSDSTVLRNVGVALGHTLLGWDSCVSGLSQVEADPARLREDLEQAWEVLAEPIQTVMRRHGVEEPYEQLKALTRGKDGITRDTLHAFINKLEIPEGEKQRLLELTPTTYIGFAARLARDI
jgi:adenylosuccinate lyase